MEARHMLEVVKGAMAALQEDAAAYSPGVLIWMKVMAAVLFSAVLFAPTKTGARWILVAALGTAFGLILFKVLFPDASRTAIGTIVHLTLWPIVLAMVWKPDSRRQRRHVPQSVFHRTYTVWLITASAIMAVSILLDIKAALGWL
tara:strand:+ start:150 stop:584 length:435 start_codon:yes stop_codon:yes gene_type:complete